MLTLSGTLAAHQKSSERKPNLSLTTLPYRFGTPLLRFSRAYTGSETDTPVAAAVDHTTGALCVLRNDAGTLKFYSYLPGTNSPGSWSTLDTGLAAGQGVALASRPSSSNRELVAVYGKGSAVYSTESTDGGATWSAPTSRAATASAVGAVAAAFRNGTANQLVALFTLPASPTALYRLRRAAGTWGAAVNWTNAASVTTVSAVAITHDTADFVVLVTGTTSGATANPRVWTAYYGDLALPINTWTSLVTLAEADSSSSVTFSGAAIAYHSPSLTFHAVYVHKEAGNVAANTARLAHTPPTNTATSGWSEPRPFETTTTYGPALAYDSAFPAAFWLATPSGAWSAALTASSDDLSARLLSARVRFTPDSTSATFDLDNHDGALNALPNASYPATLAGGQVTLLPRYTTSAGTEGPASWVFRIDQVEHRYSGLGTRDSGRSTVVLHCSGAWEQLARTRAAQAWQTAAGALNRYQVVSTLAARAGLRTAAESDTGYTPSSTFTAYSPAFALAPGETIAAALKRLLAPLSDAVRHEPGTLTTTGIASGSALAAFGGSGEHPIASLRLIDAAPPATWIRLWGASRYADSWDQSTLDRFGAALQIERNLDAGSDAKATEHAAAALARALWQRPAGELTVPAHVALELFDLVSVTSAQLGHTATTCRVLGLGLDYARGPNGAHYDTTLLLGAV